MQEIKTGFGTPFLVVWPYILPQEKDYFSPRPQIFSSIFPRISTSQSLAGKFVMVNCIVKLIFYTMKSPILQTKCTLIQRIPIFIWKFSHSPLFTHAICVEPCLQGLQMDMWDSSKSIRVLHSPACVDLFRNGQVT